MRSEAIGASMAGCNIRNNSDGDDDRDFGSFSGHIAGALGQLGPLERFESNFEHGFSH